MGRADVRSHGFYAMPTRTFLALDMDALILDRLAEAQRRLDDGQSKVNWVARENLHVTMNFLGDVPDEILHEVCNLAAAAASEIEPFEFHVQGVACVPPAGQPRMFWAMIDDPTGRMLRLRRALDAALDGLGLRQEDRSFKPHVTLARIKFSKHPRGLRAGAKDLADQEFGVQHAEELVAYASRLGSGGPTYLPLARAKLGG